MRLIKSVCTGICRARSGCSNRGIGREDQAGQYFMASIIDVCLKSDGTWYYTTFAGNIGGWETTGLPDAQIIMWGATIPAWDRTP